MKHLLLLAYAFPPVLQMSATRNWLRAQGFEAEGYQVSVVTREWRKGHLAHGAEDACSGEILVEKISKGITVYRVPFSPHKFDGFHPVQRMLFRCYSFLGAGFMQRIIGNILYFILPMDFNFRLSVNPAALAALLPQKPDYVLASADPWSNFEIGKTLARHFGAKYIAEYRDPWGYSDPRFRIEGFNAYNSNFFSQLKRSFAKYRERILNYDADLVISVSKPVLENALEQSGAKRGAVITNCFNPAELQMKAEKFPKFTLTYIGTIYSQQKAEIFFKALDEFVEKNQVPLDSIRVKMIGSARSHGFEKTMLHIKKFRHYERVVEFIDRVEKQESLRIQKASSLLLYFAHANAAGIMSGKIFEYIAIGTPILLVPSDGADLKQLVESTGSGIVCETIEETVAALQRFYEEWKRQGFIAFSPNRAEVEKYSLQSVTKQLMAELERL